MYEPPRRWMARVAALCKEDRCCFDSPKCRHAQGRRPLRDALLARHAIFSSCVTSQKSVCKGGWDTWPGIFVGTISRGLSHCVNYPFLSQNLAVGIKVCALRPVTRIQTALNRSCRNPWLVRSKLCLSLRVNCWWDRSLRPILSSKFCKEPVSGNLALRLDMRFSVSRYLPPSFYLRTGFWFLNLTLYPADFLTCR